MDKKNQTHSAILEVVKNLINWNIDQEFLAVNIYNLLIRDYGMESDDAWELLVRFGLNS